MSRLVLALIVLVASAHALNIPMGAKKQMVQSLLGTHTIESLTLEKFDWKDCGAASNGLHVTAFSLSPDPIEIPGNLTLSLTAALTKTETSPLKMSVTLKKGALKIPCIDNIGSCNYADVCALLTKIPLNPDGSCPAPFPQFHIPCRCPLQPLSWNVPATSIAIPKLPPSVPSWLTSGDFSASITITEPSGAQLFCFNVDITLKAK